ncbi:hypothetical protein [Actinoplanes sp. NPDC049681]|uniref:hypothetical protein n=1 Tax=Actinoplanes sp. NPDC049681 TaxID=3363905 RepID=UPI00379118C8
MWWWGLIFTTALNGLIVGYFPMWLTAGMAGNYDRGDYQWAAGGYGTAALVLLVAAAGIRGFHGPRHPAARTAAALAFVLGLFAAVFAVKVAREPASSGQILQVDDGIFPVLFMPWTMALLIAGLIGTYELCTGKRHTDSTPSAR